MHVVNLLRLLIIDHLHMCLHVLSQVRGTYGITSGTLGIFLFSGKLITKSPIPNIHIPAQ